MPSKRVTACCVWAILAFVWPVVFAAPPASPLTSVTVQDASGSGATQWPTTVVIPLQEGQFSGTSDFRLWDVSAGQTVPAQFEVLERNWIGDNSILHVAAHFQADVSASGTREYQFADDGGNPAPSDPVQVVNCTGVNSPVTGCPENGGKLVTTGPLRFSVRSTAFNILDTVWYDEDDDGSYESGERTIQPSANHGGRYVGCDTADSGGCASTETQHDSSLTPDSITVEETGPMRAVLRVERYTRFDDSNNDGDTYDAGEQHQHGYVVRLYAYAGKPWIKIDYQLVNAAGDDHGNNLTDGRWADPLYFDSLHLDWTLSTGATTVRAADDGLGGVDSRSLPAGGYEAVFVDSHDAYEVRGADGDAFGSAISCSDPDSSGSDTDNDCDIPLFVDAGDGTLGVQAIIRFGWQQWPNAIEVDGSKKLSLQLWPDISSQWFNGSLNTSDGIGTGDGLYWLDDMRAPHKEALLVFHGAAPSDAVLTANARNFTRHPVPTLPWSYYKSTGVTFYAGDMGPDAPTYPPAFQDKNIPGGSGMLDETATSPAYTQISPNYRYGADRYFAPMVNRLNCSEGQGNGPLGGEHFAANGDPDWYFYLESWALQEINGRPEWMGTDYTWDDDGLALNMDPSQPYQGSESQGCDSGGGSISYWRANENPVRTNHIVAGTRRNIDPRSDPHNWSYHTQDWYWMSGNLWLRDWARFLGEIRQLRTDPSCMDNPTTCPVDKIDRAEGHALKDLLWAYRVHGDTAHLTALAEYAWRSWDDHCHPVGGCGHLWCGARIQVGGAGGLSGLQSGFFMRPVAHAADHLKGNAWPQWAKAFALLSAYTDAQYNRGHFNNNVLEPDVCGDGTAQSSGTGWPLEDELAWYYWRTGRTKYLDLVNDYHECGLNSSGDRDATCATESPSDDPACIQNSTRDTMPCDAFDPLGSMIWSGEYEGRVFDGVRAAARPDATPPAAVSNLAATLAGSTLSLSWSVPSGTPSYYLIAWSDKPLDAAEPPNPSSAVDNWWDAPGLAACSSDSCTGGTIIGNVSCDPCYAALFAFDAADNMSAMSNVASSTPGTLDPPQPPQNLEIH